MKTYSRLTQGKGSQLHSEVTQYQMAVTVKNQGDVCRQRAHLERMKSLGEASSSFLTEKRKKYLEFVLKYEIRKIHINI